MTSYDHRSPPMMKCGHAANSDLTRDGVSVPACVICHGVYDDDRAITVAEAPDLTGRESYCAYYRPGYRCADPECKKAPHCPPNHHNAHGGDYPSVAPSSAGLPFFEHVPSEPHDRHFCGCWGWD